MKIKKSWIVIMMAAAAMLTACSRDLAFDEVEAPLAQPSGVAGQSETDLVPVTFTVSDMIDFTRAASNIVSFNSGEAIKVCVKPNGAANYTGYTYTTAAAGQTDVTLTAPATPPYFPVAAPRTVQAYAYYPATASSDGTTATTFTVQANQISNANYKLSDLMYASNRTITKGSSTGTNLQMAHLMAQLHLNVTAVGLSVKRVLVNAKPSVTFTPSAGTAVVTGTKSDIVAATAVGHAYVCIPEQPISNVTVKIETGEEYDAATTATFTFTSDANFTAGDTHLLTLTLTAAQLGVTTAIANWNGQQSVTYTPTGDLTIDDISAKTYKGSAYTYSDLSSQIVVKKSGTPLTYGTDYDIALQNNTNAGTAVVVATGKGTYAGSVAVGTFTINPKTLTDAMVASISAQTYTRSQITPAVTVTDGSTLTLNKDYTVSYGENINVADGGSATVTGTGNYTGSVEKNFTISPKSVSGMTLTLSQTSPTFTASYITASVSSLTDDEYQLVQGTDFTVSGTTSSMYPGDKTITANGQGNYTGSKSGTWTIAKAPTSVTTAPTMATDWIDDGNAHNLLETPGVASTGGSMRYYKSTTYSKPSTSASGWSSSIPQTTVAGTYYVWYYSMGGSYYSNSPVGGPLIVTFNSPYTPLSSATASDVGKIICSYRHIHSTVSDVDCGGSAVAMIVYLGNAGTADASSSTYKGLAIALTNADTNVAWYGTSSSYNARCLTSNPNSRSSTFTDYWNNSTSTYGKLEGIANTERLTGKKVGNTSVSSGTHCGHTHPAADAALNYSVAVPPRTSGWFLPSGGQWMKFFGSAGMYLDYWTDWGYCPGWSGSSNTAANLTKVKDMFDNAGASLNTDDTHWTSSEYDDTQAVHVSFRTSYGVYFSYLEKYYTSGGTNTYIRAFLAF